MTYDIKKIAENVIRNYEGCEESEICSSRVCENRKSEKRRNECLLHAILILVKNVENLSDETFLLLYLELTKEFCRRFSCDMHSVIDNIAESLLVLVSEES